jgi:hypothetical protein
MIITDKVDMINHLRSRHINIDLHKPSISNTTATFFLYNFSGQIVGWQKYSPNNKKTSCNDTQGRYYTYRSNDRIALFGLESITNNTNTIFVTEGIFDAARLTNKGCGAVALLTNSPNSSIKNFLYCISKKLVIVCDSDVGGDFLRKSLKGFGYNFYTPSAKDLGEAEESEVQKLINTFI